MKDPSGARDPTSAGGWKLGDLAGSVADHLGEAVFVVTPDAPEEGRVTVRISPEGKDAFRIEFEDTGIGIKSENLERLFVEFQQLDATTSKKYQGTGLGLAFTKKIIEAQGGQVGVRSRPGEGSVFHAILPRAPGKAAGARSIKRGVP